MATLIIFQIFCVVEDDFRLLLLSTYTIQGFWPLIEEILIYIKELCCERAMIQ